MKKVQCIATQHRVAESEAVRGEFIRPELKSLIQKDHPDFNDETYISKEALNEYRKRYLAGLIQQETQEISDLEKEVLDAMTNDTLIADRLVLNGKEAFTLGQRLADRIADFGGSWTFISIFFAFLMLWMAVNVWLLAKGAFDPYPFILLNLILSCLAAIQAPIIMMSQNRQEAKDRQRNEHDYKVNLKAELEIRLLHEKLDHLIVHQNQKLLAIQELQMDYLEEIQRQLKKS